MHYTAKGEGPKKKPVLILDYNKNKGGADNMDKCLAEYSTKRWTNRWTNKQTRKACTLCSSAEYWTVGLICHNATDVKKL